MSNTLDSTIAGAVNAARSSRGVAVIYWRGDLSLPITVTPAEDRYEADAGDGTRTMMFVRDYLILASDLDFGGGVVSPERGDQIKQAMGDVVDVYEVVSLAAEPAWRYMDPGHTWVRVHTKKVDQE